MEMIKFNRKKPNNANTEAFSALCSPFIKASIPGINLNNLKNLNTLNTLKISKKLRPCDSLCRASNTIDGSESSTRIKSNLFHAELIYAFQPKCVIFTIASIRKRMVY
jgi:hypothetical protein